MARDSLVETTAELIRHLERLAERLDRSDRQTTDVIALLRGSLNHMVYAGMFNVGAGLQNRIDGQIPFRALAFADVNGIGPLNFDVASEGGGGIGSVAAKVNMFGCVPIVGRSLAVTTASAGSLFVALYTTAQPFTWGLL